MRLLTVLHRDEHLVAIDKPAGVLVVAAPGRSGATLVDMARAQLELDVRAVHRLDEDTTGILLFALSEAAQAGMEALFRTHTVRREYLALLASSPSPPAGRIESQLREGPDGIVRVVAAGGVRAVTHYETIARRGLCTLTRVRLETGRRNQIRVHMAAMGCPLAGDRKYGFRARAAEHFPRVMLHSWRASFRHPITGAELELTCPPHEDVLRP